MNKKQKPNLNEIDYYKSLIDKRLLNNPNRQENQENVKSSPKVKKVLKELNDLDLVLGVYRFVCFNYEKYAARWNYSLLTKYLDETTTTSTDKNSEIIKWFTLKIFSLLLSLTPIQTRRIQAIYFNSTQCAQLLLIEHALLLNSNMHDLSNEITFKFKEFEHLNIKNIKTNFTQINFEEWKYFEKSDADDAQSLVVEKYVDFDGLKLERKPNSICLSKNEDVDLLKQIVFVETTRKNLNKIVMSIISDNCIVIEGDLSTGKTMLVEYLSKKTNNELIKYQMDDFMDSKSLIGNFVCSEIPGEFLWKAGPLYHAVHNGNWLLLEDFDHAPVDSLSLLIDLLETKCIKTTDHTMPINENFRLFLTIRSSNGKRPNTNFIDSITKLSRYVYLEKLNDTESVKILCEKYPNFKLGSSTSLQIAEKLLQVFKSLDFLTDSSHMHTSSLGQTFSNQQHMIKENRLLTLRDLLKICNRILTSHTMSSSYKILHLIQDINECFLGFISNKQARIDLIIKIGSLFNVNKEEIINLFVNTKPSFIKSSNKITCGRVRLELEPTKSNEDLLNQSSIFKESVSRFVYTKSSLSLLEKVSRCIECNEPVLLCGETGVGKTTVLQHLAKLLGKPLSVINLNHQTETSDLLGSFKPIDTKLQMKILKEKFLNIFTQSFSLNENQTFLNHIQNCYTSSNWIYLVKLISHATNQSIEKFKSSKNKRLKDWKNFKIIIDKVETNFDMIVNKCSFRFVEGKLTQAIQNGEWVILDEINLASSETLQFLSILLENTQSKSSSIVLYEKGDDEPLIRHEQFRLFGAMNPANDIGKRNLPPNIRNRFTEIFVDELDNEHDLNQLIKTYLSEDLEVSNGLVKSIVDFYMQVRDESFLKKLSNGIGMPPNYSLRTLCRALRNASTNNFTKNALFSVYDSLCLSFLTDLNRESTIFLEDFIRNAIYKSSKVKVNQHIDPSLFSSSHIQIENYWIAKGTNEPKSNPSFIFTKSVKDNLKRLARVCSARLPCLIQGDTSIGKTSLIKWLSDATGNVLIRINNHDHTDLQEYIGNYMTDPTSSKLIFKEGLLVQAMRNGYWILLDELNLASSEVLEALNRVLDDNRELYIPETQEIIKAHPRFLLFATQNPPGKYAGRKQLSRAFRNRFIELHFDELPDSELLTIVENKCKLPNTYATLLIKTITELKTKRSQISGIFQGKHSLITLRDLFRWANRYSHTDSNESNQDWKQYLAEQGFLILSSRCRAEQDVLTIHKCIESVFKKKINLNFLDTDQSLSPSIMNVLKDVMAFSNTKEFKKFVWTNSAKRVALLAGLAYKFNEPFLLIGETGLGKTTICQILSLYHKKHLHIINCHMHSEAADFLGSMRPIRHDSTGNSEIKQLFEWKDGPLVTAIKNGEDLMIDEISLADDSVLERLNSVLEEEKTLLLAENTSDNAHSIKANESFRIFATMNPSGDFGKKELSTALRNRFTEIWCPTPDNDSDEFRVICQETLHIDKEQIKSVCVTVICDFFLWLSQKSFFNKKKSSKGIFSIRDLTSWIQFINRTSMNPNCFDLSEKMLIYKPLLSLIHGACLIFIDSLDLKASRQACIDYLFDRTQSLLNFNIAEIFYDELNCISIKDDFFKCGPFSIRKGDLSNSNEQLNLNYCLGSQTVAENVQRIVRCLMLDAPIMLEGSPGVGKTSLVESLAKITNNKLIRINLSEQTDLNELFGADLPTTSVENNMQHFEWHDGPFLQGLKQGHWIILDEINLASQSVLEGLNSCFDHRNEIFISELNKKFLINTERTKIFACQNPYIQGGGRKGLPKSFLNRFSKVYVDQMTPDDLLFIVGNVYKQISVECLTKMIQFNELINKQVCQEKQWGTLGSPWEFNLRDIFRWCEVMLNDQNPSQVQPGDYVYLIYSSRFRTKTDKNHVAECFRQVFGYNIYEQDESSLVRFTQTHLQLGQSILKYDHNRNKLRKLDEYVFTESSLKYLEAICKCLEMNWMSILVGKSCTGKTTLVRMLSQIMDKNLIEYSVNNSTDTSDLLGGFEKITHLKKNIQCVDEIIHQSYLNRVLKLNKNKTISESLKSYFDYIFASKSLFKSLLKIEENLGDDLKIFLDLFHSNLDKLKELKSIPRETYEKALKLIKEMKSTRKNDSIKFEWMDSSLVKAIENGDWVLIDNANFCAASVLDRLNPLLETNGSLHISEKNATIRPHKDFRIFLSVNESFGELSRPMRNRGVEIYFNELDPINDQQDIKLILHCRFPFSETNKEIDFLYEKIIDENELDFKKLRIKKLSFLDILKIVKLTYDFWLIDDTKIKCEDFLLKCFRRTLQELHLHEEKINVVEIAQAASKSFEEKLFYFADVLKLKDFHLYKFLYDIPLFTKLMLELSHFLQSQNSPCAYNFDNSSALLKNSTKTTQLIQIWLKNIPIEHIQSIIEFTGLNLSTQKMVKITKEKVETFFRDLCSIALKNPMFELYSKSLSDLSQTINIDLTHETLDISSNRFICDKVTLVSQDIVNQLKTISMVLNLIMELNLSKFRIKSSYRLQDDSLLSKIKQLNFDVDLAQNLNENCQLEETEKSKRNSSSSQTNESKYLLLIEEFLERFLNEMTLNLTDYTSKNIHQILTSNKEETLYVLRNCLYLFEKFYLICSCSYDSVLTLPYLKFYWCFLNDSLKNVQQTFFSSRIWSNDLQSLASLFDKKMFFDVSIYMIYIHLWQSNRPSLEIKNTKTLKSISKLNSNLIHSNILIDKNMSASKFYNLLKHFLNQKTISTNHQTSLTVFDSNLIVDELNCCDEMLEKIPENDTVLTLRKLFIDAQISSLYHFVNTLNELKLITSNRDESDVTNLNFCHLMTKNFKLGKFYSIFKQMSNKCFSFVDLFYEGLKSYQNNEDHSDDTTIFSEFKKFANETSSLSKQNYTPIASFIHSNWLDEYLSKIYTCKLNKESNKKASNYIFSIELVLNLFDRKLLKFNEMNNFLWSNFDFLSKNCSTTNVQKTDENLVAYLKVCLEQLKLKNFDNNEQKFIGYLNAKNFKCTEMFKLNSNRDNVLIEIVILGSILAHMFSPMDPMDPLEYENLNKKLRMESIELENNRKELEELNNSKLKKMQTNSNLTKTDETTEGIPIRESKAEYFLIKNEFDTILKQFCSYNQLKKLIESFDLNRSTEKDFNITEIEFQTWFTSLDRFTQKIADTHYSYYDIIYLPLNGISLIGYAMNALYTHWRSQASLKKSDEIVSLIKILHEYPYKRDHVLIAEQLTSMTEKICDPFSELGSHATVSTDILALNVNFELMDELNFLSLLHLFNDNQSIKKKTSVLVKQCKYYSKRFIIFNRLKAEKEKVETFKYKAYGQKEIEEELERVEIEKAYPSYSNHFEDLLPVNVLDSNRTVRSDLSNEDFSLSNEEQIKLEEEKYLLDDHILPQTFDMIELILNDFSEVSGQTENKPAKEEALIKTFYRSYSIAASLIQKYNISMPTLDKDSENYAIISHILFGSSINLNTHSFNMNANFVKDTDIFTDAKQSSFSLYNIYYDSNHEQVLKCKKTLDNLKARVHLLLIEWTENPLLLEILKIVKRIETFQLNDSLMKYLTGLELVLQKAENWQIVAAQKYSLEAELKQINELIVEWRKMELTFWQNSLELEYYEIKKKTAHVWFYNIFSCCAEFLKQSNDWFDNSEFLESLMQFIQTSTFGEYFIRMKNLKMCLQIFENYDVSSSSSSNNNPKARITELKNSLHSIISFFDSVFSKLILDDILKNKKSIEKELKDFVAIHRWQDANYWSLKQSTAKSREKIFKTTKKFRVYLNQKLDFNKLVNSSMLNVCFLTNNTENKLNKTFKLGDLAQKKNSKFLGEMEKFTKKILTKKFFKTNFFDSITEYSTNLYERYLDLDVSTNSLTNQSKSLTKKDKELTDKLKKDAKNLNSQKCKFISDIMKDLNFMGLSYRKGQIMFSEKNQQLNKILMFDRPVFYESDQLKAFFTEGEYNYYLCTHNFLSFKSLMSSQNLQQQADMGHLNVIPFQKLIGYADHFYHVVNKQKDVLNKFVSNQSHFKFLNQILTLVSNSNIFNQTLNRSQETRVDYLNEFLKKALSLVKQIELFFKHLEKNCTDANQTTSIGASFQSINSKMDQLKNYLASSSKNPVLVDRLSQMGYHENKIKKAECLLKKLKLTFMNDRDFQELKQLNNCLNEENDLNKGLNDLLHTANLECKPFAGIFQQLVNDLSNLNQQNDACQNQKVEVTDEIANKLLANSSKRSKKIVDATLKTVEVIYKKYLTEKDINNNKKESDYVMEKKFSFIEECFQNFSEDFALTNIEEINDLIKESLRPVKKNENLNEEILEKLKLDFKKTNDYLCVYNQLISNWLTYSTDLHTKSCKFLNILLFIFSEFKSKGLKLPQELQDENEQDVGQSHQKNKKFETDDQDPAGLGDGDGIKDVSDQIENEDQLDDAKNQEQRDKEKNEKPDENPIKEEEKGIEMSEDFEGALGDVQMEDQEENREDEESKDGDEEEDGIDDQKGEVDNANNALDEQLWNDEANKDEEDEEDGEKNLEDKIEGGEAMEDQKSELVSKENLPVSKNEKQKNKKDNETNAKEDESQDEQNEDDGEGPEEIMNQDDFNEDEDNQSQADNNENNIENENDHAEGENFDLDEESNKGDLTDEEKNENQIEEDMSDVNTETDENEDLNNKNIDKENFQEENMEEADKPKRDFNKNTEKKTEKNQIGTNDQNNEIEMDEEMSNDEDNENSAEQESKLTNEKSGKNNQVSRANLEDNSEDGEDKKSNEMEKQMGQKNENRIQSDDKKEFNEKNFNILNENDNENETNKENRLNNENDTELDSAKQNTKRDFKHIKNANEKFDASVYDAATESQKRKIDQQQDKQFDEDLKPNSSKKRHLDKEEPLVEKENDLLENKKLDTKKNKNKKESNETVNSKEIKEEEIEPMSTSDFVSTLGVNGRPIESSYSTSIENFDFKKTREELELELKKFRETENFKFTTEPDVLTSDSIKLWLEYEALTQQLSKELCEQLRLILEPTVCSKLKGDYKTGKRLNMKRVVEYIATEYRKDKIWLRRTKPNKRDYEIMLAVDNSCSMSDNHCIQLAYETIATLSNAFQYLEVGKFGLLSFGEKVNQLVDLQEQFNSDIGAKILSRVNFQDDKTNVAQMLNFATDVFASSQSKTMRSNAVNVPVSKLLIILSDGRGIFYEGIERVKNSIQYAIQNEIFIVFVILDTPGKNSIFDIKMPIFKEGNPVPIIKSYMENFPFPFYVVLKEINSLPTIITEALKQWFEMVSKIDSK